MATSYQRTQVLLPTDLVELIDLDRDQKKESRSEYLRQAAKLRLENQEKKRLDLKALANEVIGKLNLSKYPEWSTRQKVLNWQKALRNEQKV